MADQEFGLELVDADGEALAELAALAEAEALAVAEVREHSPLDVDAGEAMAAELAEMRRALEAERAALRGAVARYRVALLAGEPTLPAELVEGESIEAVDASVDAARRAVAQIREQLGREAHEARGFPSGSPAREEFSSEGMSAAEKIAAGLARFER